MTDTQAPPAEETAIKEKGKPGPKPKATRLHKMYELWRVEFKIKRQYEDARGEIKTEWAFEKLKLIKKVSVDDWVVEELNMNTNHLNPYHYYLA